VGDLVTNAQVSFEQAGDFSKKLGRTATLAGAAGEPDCLANAGVQFGGLIDDPTMLNAWCNGCPFAIPEEKARPADIC